MFSASQSDCTVVIPTFNRPAELGMLLRYLAHHEAGFPILVLDASDEEFRERNLAAVAGWPLNADIRAFAARLPFYETVAAGVAAVETPIARSFPMTILCCPTASAWHWSFCGGTLISRRRRDITFRSFRIRTGSGCSMSRNGVPGSRTSGHWCGCTAMRAATSR